jgi:hypothetical protein
LLFLARLLLRTYVYVDGFNLYYGALKGTPFRWLNLVELARQFLPPGHSVDKVKYFTARVSGVSDPGAPGRQQIYLNALGTLPKIEIHFGSFLAKTVWRPLTNLPIAGQQIASRPPVTLAAGNHTVIGPQQRTLPVGRYAESRGGKSEASQADETPTRRSHRRSPYHGRERLGR